MARELTEKQRSFAIHLASGLSQKEAYRKAYSATSSDNTASGEGGKLARDPRIRAYVDQLKADTGRALTKQVAEGIALDRHYVLANLKEVVERCMQHAPVLDRSGKPTGEYTFDSKGANQALGMIGKELGMFVERREVRHGPLVDATDEQLDAELAGLAREMSALTGKPLKQILLESVRTELAIDVTPIERAAAALPANDDALAADPRGGA